MEKIEQKFASNPDQPGKYANFLRTVFSPFLPLFLSFFPSPLKGREREREKKEDSSIVSRKNDIFGTKDDKTARK